ncbi:DEAD-box ATP-dependent RNA helicase 31-like [Argentina anserina]|uniref:DEAD-box ATP-dependent RNA helicase 31-like n=1 Tax=Argentina anserina TaxID=57926 RepID=UPI0021762CAB|nr:DEAD-box ATP-dependent RNA helicase 31-like [Potentilla anserina]
MKTTSLSSMPVKLLPQLRLLNNPTGFLSMKFGPSSSSIFAPRPVPAFSRAFPLRLRYLALGSHRTLSSRAFRTGSSGSGSGSQFARGYERKSVGGSKSLVDDEAELSDWVSELRTDPTRRKGDDFDGDRRGRVRDRGGDRDREAYPVKRSRRDSGGGADEFGTARGGFRSSPMSRREDGGRGGGGRGGRSFPTRSSRGGSSSFGDRRPSSNPRMERRFDNKFGDNAVREDEFSARRSPNFKASSSSVAKRGGREVDSSFRRGGGGGEWVRKDSIKKRPVVDDSDEDEVDELGSGIGGLQTEEDSDSAASEDDEDEEDGREVLKGKSAAALFGSDKVVSQKAVLKSSGGDSESYLSDTRFDQCSVSPLSLKGIKDAGYENMTVVQEATLPVILKGKDVLAKAKTGTGKTVAFLLPSIEVVVNSPPIGRDHKRPPISVLVICPTRELANQAAVEATKLLKYHPSIGVQVVIGGTRLALEQKRMQANPCQILVATPGRLKDHIENTAGFATRLMGVKVLILDEADHLLDMGFRKDIERIIAAVPKQRQTLLFSATVPEEVRQICHIALKRDHEYITTVVEGSEETHAQVRQTHLVAPLDKHFSYVYSLLKEHIADDLDYKVLVFCTTAMVTRLVANLLGELNLNVREIHSRKPQSYRTRVSDEFRKSKGLILVTSDVSARGVDYPDVTLVIQVGIPADRQQYIHRLGRTGRKGKEGQGILLLAPWEEFFLSTIKDLPMTKAPVPLIDPDTTKKVERALSQVDMKNKEAAYQAWLGYYNSNKKIGRDKHRLVELANEFSRSMGLDNPPAIAKMVLGKMGLKNVPGLRSK